MNFSDDESGRGNSLGDDGDPASLLDKSENLQRTKRKDARVMPRKVSLSRLFVSALNNINGATTSNGGPLLPGQRLQLRIINTLSKKVAGREYGDHSIINLDNDMGHTARKHRGTSTDFLQSGPKEQDKKRLKVSEFHPSKLPTVVKDATDAIRNGGQLVRNNKLANPSVLTEQTKRGADKNAKSIPNKPENEVNGQLENGSATSGPDQSEYICFNRKWKKDFFWMETVKGETVNILEGLELHNGVFDANDQKRIVEAVYKLQEKGKNGELKEHTYSAPRKWKKGKGRVTMQFGCCYNFATDKHGNPPGILKKGIVDPIPDVIDDMIKRLVKWHILPPSCVPDSCIVNIYEVGDCIPPHIDSHDFVRPFCTVSFLSQCDILFGTKLKILSAGKFAGSVAVPLPCGSVLVLNGNAAELVQHCVPAVPTKRISVTLRKMDESRRPVGFIPDLQGTRAILR